MSKKTSFPLDFGILVPVIVLILIGLTTLFSINATFFRSQLLFLVLGVCAYLFFSQAPSKALRLYTMPLYVFSIILLVITFFIGIESRGAVRWVDIFGVRIQFSEVLKPILALVLSAYLSQRDTSFKNLFLVVCFFTPVAFLIFFQPDLGNALLYALTLFFTLLVFGFPFYWFGVLFFMLLAFLPLGWHMLHQYQRERVLTFLYPMNDPLGKSYNAIQSIIAVGSGSFLGKGLQESTQSSLRFLPERHTDFIFATLSEGLGFIGSSVIVIAFVFLLYRIFLVYLNSDEPFCKIYAASTFFIILIQSFVNIGMNIGIMPVVGVTLPFVSYGGSSLISNFIFLGILNSMSRKSKQERVLEIK